MSMQLSLLVTSTGAVLRHVIRHTFGANLRTVPLHATATVARGGTRWSRVSWKPQGKEACDSYGCGCGCHIRDLLVSNTGTVPPFSLQLCWFLLFSITYHITQCPFYYVPHYESYTAQEACSRQDLRALRNSSMIQGRLDYMGRTDCKIPEDAGFVFDTAAVTTTVLRDAIKLTPCICFCFWQSFKPCHFNSNKSPTRCSNFSVYYSEVYLQLNMFRAFSRPSSKAQWLQWQPQILPSYRCDSRAVFVVGPPR
jgi:hypothetical protein